MPRYFCGSCSRSVGWFYWSWGCTCTVTSRPAAPVSPTNIRSSMSGTASSTTTTTTHSPNSGSLSESRSSLTKKRTKFIEFWKLYRRIWMYAMRTISKADTDFLFQFIWLFLNWFTFPCKEMWILANWWNKVPHFTVKSWWTLPLHFCKLNHDALNVTADKFPFLKVFGKIKMPVHVYFVINVFWVQISKLLELKIFSIFSDVLNFSCFKLTHCKAAI